MKMIGLKKKKKTRKSVVSLDYSLSNQGRSSGA